MIPLSVFLLACAAVYLGAIEAAFSALMRLSLRLVAERTNRPGALGAYLDDPLLLFIPVRLLMGLVIGAATALITRETGVEGAHTLPTVLLSLVATPTVREQIREGRTAELPSTLHDGSMYGMQTFTQALHRRYTQGDVELEEALRYADSPEELQLAVREIRSTRDVQERR